MNKFEPLKNFLSNSGSPTIKMSFEELESIIDDRLPPSAKNHRAYFANTDTHSISKAWMEAGYRVSDVDYYEKIITFEKQEPGQDCLLSADLLVNCLDETKTLSGKNYISAFSLYEIIMFRGRFEQDVFAFLGKNRIKIVDIDGAIIDFDTYVTRSRNIGIFLANIYNSAIKYALINCFINVAEKSDRDAMIDLFASDNAENLLIDFPVCYDQSVWEIYLKRFTDRVAKHLNKDAPYRDCMVESIGKLDYGKMSLISVSGATYLEINYLNFALKRFICTCADNKPFIPFSFVNEMLNIIVLSEQKMMVYYTDSEDHFDILLGCIRNRVIKGRI